MHLRPFLRLLAPVGVMVCVLGFGTGSASAAVNCTFVSGSGAVTVTTDPATVATVSVDVGGAILVNGSQCSTATVTNTDSIHIGASGDSAVAGLDLSGGAFAPGLTTEGSGASEIEVTIDLPGDSLPFIRGTSGADTFVLGSGGANLNGDADVDVIVVGTPSFTLSGLGGSDTLSSTGDIVTGGSYPGVTFLDGGDDGDILNGGAAREVLTGGTGDDTLHGGGGFDTLLGGPGFDFLDGGAGNDSLDGGSQDDWAAYGNAPGPVNATLPGGTAAGQDGYGTTDTYVSIERLEGSQFADVLTGDRHDNLVFAGDGDDTIDLGGGDDRARGFTGNDIINGGAGDDSLDGDDGNDVVSGGAGDDELTDGAGDDQVFGGGGRDRIEASEFDFDLGGLRPAGNDLLSGGAGVDEVDYWFRPGVTVSLDGFANDGGSGEADNVGGPANDVENVVGSPGGDVLTGNDRANTLDGFTGGDDYLDGQDGADTLIGGVGSDHLIGGEGKDLLDGGSGTDKLEGGDGRDEFLADDNEQDFVDGGVGNDFADVDRAGDGSPAVDLLSSVEHLS